MDESIPSLRLPPPPSAPLLPLPPLSRPARSPGYRELAEGRWRRWLSEREDVLGRAGRDSASLSPESLLPRVAVRRIDVFESGGEAKRVEKTIHEHGQWLGLLRPVGLDAVEQAVVYEDDFRRGVRRFAFVPHRSKL